MSHPLRAGLAALFLLLAFASSALAQSAAILPNGRTQFLDNNGSPLGAGNVFFYIPNTTTPKTTWADAGELTPNPNPVPLDSSGEALIYGSGNYRQVVQDALGNTVWDAATAALTGPFPAYGGTSSGSANAQTVAASSFAAVGGSQLVFKVGVGLTNTSATTLTVGATSYALVKDVAAGPTALSGGELVAGNLVLVTYDPVAGNLHLSGASLSWPFVGPQTSVAGAATVNLGNASATHSVLVTGSGWTITSFGSAASTLSGPLYLVVFNSTGTITYNATSLITPQAASIAVTAGSSAEALYLGSGNWQIVRYTAAGYAAYKLLGVQTFTSGGTYTPSVGAIYIKALCVGAGAAGGSITPSGGSADGTAGGGGGSGARSWYYGGNATTQVVTIGAAGTAVPASTGNAGGDTSLGSLCVAKGGQGGVGGVLLTSGYPGGLGGLAAGSTGTIKESGQAGGSGIGQSTGLCTTGIPANGGPGGGPGGANGGSVATSAATSTPAAATGFGGGGGGGAACNTTTATPGSAGAPGAVQVEEYGL